VTANAPLTVQNLVLSSGTLNGPADVTVNGSLTWTSGTMSGAGRTILNGPSSLTGGFFSMLDGRTVENFGAAVGVPNNSLTFANNAVWINRPGATLDLPGNAGIGNFFASSAQIVNEGLLRKSGTGTSSVAIAIENRGMVEVQAGGTLALTGYVQTAG